jgi:predicted DsbA family dithiol-disulfide isomerase
MQVDVWSDVMCPWCAVGRANLMAALERYDGEEPITVNWRSFELRPDAPRVVEGDYVQQLADKYGRSRDEAQAMVDQMADRGKEVGIDFDFANIRPGNTFDAHRLLHLAREHDLQDALKDRLFRAYFEEGQAVGTHDVLVACAVEVGIPEERVRAVLDGEEYGGAVRGDEGLASQLGIRGVPFFVFDQRVAVNGAQPVEHLLAAFDHTLTTREPADSETCSVDGC